MRLSSLAVPLATSSISIKLDVYLALLAKFLTTATLAVSGSNCWVFSTIWRILLLASFWFDIFFIILAPSEITCLSSSYFVKISLKIWVVFLSLKASFPSSLFNKLFNIDIPLIMADWLPWSLIFLTVLIRFGIKSFLISSSLPLFVLDIFLIVSKFKAIILGSFVYKSLANLTAWMRQPSSILSAILGTLTKPFRIFTNERFSLVGSLDSSSSIAASSPPFSTNRLVSSESGSPW